MNKGLFALAAGVLLAACTGTQKHDTAYYKAHADERDTKIMECRGIAGSFDNNKECIAAALAEDVRPLSFWKENSGERKAKVAECKEHGATLGQSENCLLAHQAQAAAFGSGGKPVYLNNGK
jgi:hypothetical protein